MTAWEDYDTSGGACESLPLEQGVDLFFPTSDGGHQRRTKAWPKPDNHAEARRHCGQCGVLAACLAGALGSDGWTFRGGMSAEERAALGGFRDVDARKRGVYLTLPQVAARLVEAGIDLSAVGRVVAAWQNALKQDPATATSTGSVVDEDSPVTGPQELRQMARGERARLGVEDPPARRVS